MMGKYSRNRADILFQMGVSVSRVHSKSDKEEATKLAPEFVGSRILNGCDLVVGSAGARAALLKFLERGEWMKQVLYEEKEAGSVLEYRLPEGSTLSDFETKFSCPIHNDPRHDVDFFHSGQHLTPILLASVFPLFLQSREYEDWVLSQTSGSDNSAEEVAKRIVRLNNLFNSAPSIVDSANLSNKVVVEALKTIDAAEFNDIVETGTWLDSLMRMVENLPLPVSVASARGDHGFPLIYVNKAFERISGYDRSEIVGHNCRFLQSAATEPGQVKLLAAALRSATPIKVALTNVRKDGTHFGNLLAMKPVFDSEGVYAFVVGVQCDISDPAVAHRTIRTVEDLLTILPNILM